MPLDIGGFQITAEMENNLIYVPTLPQLSIINYQLSVDINYLIVGGGGSGGCSYQYNSNVWCPGAGAGAGGYVVGNLTLQEDTQYSIIIGGGGSTGSNGTDSSFNSIVAYGGGYGNGGNGASGGGGTNTGCFGAGTGISGQGNDGGDPNQFEPYIFGGLTGGGGGASQFGSIGSTVTVQPNPNAPNGMICRRSGNGGNGCQWLDGNRYAGGGGGGTYSPDTDNAIYTAGVGCDGGGDGADPINSFNNSLIGCNGTVNTGGGGGGNGTFQGNRGIVGSVNSSNGGSGIVAILYCSPTQLLSGGNVTCTNGCVIHYYCTSCSISII